MKLLFSTKEIFTFTKDVYDFNFPSLYINLEQLTV